MRNPHEKNETLGQQLDAYVVSAQAHRGGWKERLASWPAYAAAVGSGLALATGAEAGIIYSGPVNISNHATAGPHETINKPLNIGGFRFALRAFRNTGQALATFVGSGSGGGGGRVFLTGTSRTLKNFARGARISGGGGSAGLALGAFSAVPPFRGAIAVGKFANSATGFAGFIMNNGDLGWVRLHATDALNPPVKVTLTALDWAYNDVPGGPITAGEGLPAGPGPVPEPNTVLMTVLAAGSLGILAWRKRRQQPVA